MKKILLIIGILFTFVGTIPIILYINLLYFGYTFKEYINDIIKSNSAIYFIVGFIILNIYFFKEVIHDKSK